ncbi:MAG: RdgB/HAM1 family non-canonical purine NTP pyrophosphatase [Alphaproteobacteria bacterium]|nr:RdgB/HAM1 family non-canonical purine NTP pyrophosphatase [Alphaproteobacteria bacterium]
MKKFIIASANEHKVKEFQNMLKPFGIKVVPYKDVIKGQFEIEETGKTFAENAKIKAEAICEKTGLPTFADDSGFCIKELASFPGVRSARFAEEVGGYDKAFDDIKNRLNGRCSEAKFVCNIAFAVKGEKTLQFEGACYGFTVFPPRGENGFGYDSIFVPNSYGKTFAEMTDDEKNAISHRSVATAKFMDFITELSKEEEKKAVAKPLKTKATKVDAKMEEITPVVEKKVEEKVVDDENTFSVEVDEKFVAPEVPFSSEKNEEK